MKKLFKIVGGIFLLVCLAVAAVFYATSGVVETTDSFFAQIAAGHIEEAEKYLSSEFTKVTSSEEFELFLGKTGLKDFKSASWHSRSVNMGTGELEGEVTTTSGTTMPIKVSLIKENSYWKIYSIDRPASGLKTAQSVEIPSIEEASILVKSTTKDFSDAVLKEDFSQFYAGMSEDFTQQFSLEKFNKAFASFIEGKINLSALENFDPLFTNKPALSANNELLLEGYFPSRPSQAHFSYNYVFRDAEWKLLGINLNLKPASVPNTK